MARWTKQEGGGYTRRFSTYMGKRKGMERTRRELGFHMGKEEGNFG